MVSSRGSPSSDDALVSVVIPARDEADRIPATLASVRDLETAVPYEVIVVTSGGDDATRAAAREYGATVVEQTGAGVGNARNTGARRAKGTWLAFVDADTTVQRAYLDEMLAFVRDRGLVGATSRCRVVGPRRAKLPEVIVNRVYPLMKRPVLPGFNTFVERDAFVAVGGFPDVPNEDKAFSRSLAAVGELGVRERVLVETSGRRIADSGLAGVLWYYFRRDLRALRSDRAGDERLDRVTLAAIALAAMAGAFQLYRGLVFGHVRVALAGLGFIGGIALFTRDLTNPRVAAAVLAFVAMQLGVWAYRGMRHGLFGIVASGLQLALAVTLAYGLVCDRRSGSEPRPER